MPLLLLLKLLLLLRWDWPSFTEKDGAEKDVAAVQNRVMTRPVCRGMR